MKRKKDSFISLSKLKNIYMEKGVDKVQEGLEELFHIQGQEGQR